MHSAEAMVSSAAASVLGAEAVVSSAAAEPIKLVNGVYIELMVSNGDFLGIGEVRAGETLLRQRTPSLGCELRTPDGNQVCGLILRDKVVRPDEVVIRCSVRRAKIPVMEYMLHTVRNRENLYGWAEGESADADTEVTLRIKPVERKMGNNVFQGFSYQYIYRSERQPIFKILDRGTWEINGSAVGNEVWMRVGHVPSIVRFDKAEQRYSTENYMYGIANPNIFQFLPLQTELQGFTFQAADSGVLVTWATEVAHVRTLLEKPAGGERIFHFHQHCGDLTAEFVTSPVEVLWLGVAGADRIKRYNIYEAVRQVVHAELHKQAGIKQEYIVTYGQIEQWDEPDFDVYTEQILPVFVAAGIKRLFLPNEFQNAMNTWGLSNMCCNVDFKLSPTVGVDKLTRFCRKAADAGMVIDMWGNTALSTTTELFQWRDGKEKGIRFLPKKDSIAEVLETAKEPFVRNPSNAIEADHYTPRFAVLNFRDAAVMEYWLRCWKEAFSAGITGIFLDSSFNMTSDKFHFMQNAVHDERYAPTADADNAERFYRPAVPFPQAILSQYPAHLEMIRRMQEIGFSYCGEDLGVFGVHRHGPDVDRVMGSLPIWRESIINFDEVVVRKRGGDPLAVFFEGLAYRVMWSMRWDFARKTADLGIADPAAPGLLKVYNQVEPLMRVREILSGGAVVRYVPEEGSRKSVYWVVSSGRFPLPSLSHITDVQTGKLWRRDYLDGRQQTVYLVEA